MQQYPPPTNATKSRTPKSSVNTGPKKSTLTKRGLPLLATAFATQVMLERQLDCSNLSNSSLTASSIAATRAFFVSTSEFFI